LRLRAPLREWSACGKNSSRQKNRRGKKLAAAEKSTYWSYSIVSLVFLILFGPRSTPWLPSPKLTTAGLFLVPTWS
jgi:hypothetical protein